MKCFGCGAEGAFDPIPCGLRTVALCPSCEERAPLTVGACDCGREVRPRAGVPAECPCGARWRWYDGLPQRCGPHCADCPATVVEATVMANGVRLCPACAIERRAVAWRPGSPICVLCGAIYQPERPETNCCGACARDVLAAPPPGFSYASAFALPRGGRT